MSKKQKNGPPQPTKPREAVPKADDEPHRHFYFMLCVLPCQETEKGGV
nr:MAG TPA_asm: hypothetical protein [Caudoviricetes sp.]